MYGDIDTGAYDDWCEARQANYENLCKKEPLFEGPVVAIGSVCDLRIQFQKRQLKEYSCKPSADG